MKKGLSILGLMWFSFTATAETTVLWQVISGGYGERENLCGFTLEKGISIKSHRMTLDHINNECPKGAIFSMNLSYDAADKAPMLGLIITNVCDYGKTIYTHSRNANGDANRISCVKR